MSIIIPLDNFFSERNDTSIENNEVDDQKDEPGENEPTSEA